MSARVGRRAAITGALLACACGRPAGEPRVVRVGFQANLTNAPLLAGVSSGRLAAAMGVALETRVLRAGPRVIEAMLGDAIDVGICGPAPIVSAKARYGDDLLRIVSGCASGGASLVVTPGFTGGKTLATPQIGSSQDVALHKWLKKHGASGVRVTQLAPSNILWSMKRGDLGGAWVPEPWATRLVEEAHGIRLVDERDEWPDRSFASAVVVVRRAFYESRRADVLALTAAIQAEVKACQNGSASDDAYAELGTLTHDPGKKSIWDQAYERVDFTTDPLQASIASFARDAAALGILPATDVRALFTERA